MKRLVFVAALVVVLVIPAVPALADDLDQLFDRASEAEFSGTKLVHCQTPDGSVSQLTDVKQAGGVAVIKAKTSEVEVVARRGEYADRTGDYSRVAVVTVGSATDRSDRYAVEVVGVQRELGRRVTAVRILEDDVVRVALRFDAATGAVIRSETFNADGSVYCISEFLVFDAGRPEIDLGTITDAERTELLPYPEEQIDERRLPPTAGGFTRLDVYGGSAGTAVGYFSDGVFSFTLVIADAPIEIPEVSDVARVEIGGREYRRRFFPGQVVYVWETSRGGYALVGDLPLDLQIAVLGDLPKPGRPFFLTRWFRSLLGD
jgi:hypothetical protein